MSDIINQMLNDPSFTQQEKEWIVKFSEEVSKRVQSYGVNFGITMFSIADAIGMDLTAVHKEGPFMFALWVTLLCHFKENLKLEDMKYPTFEAFKQGYEGWFTAESDLELVKLWQIANWMSILFKMITARKNKGLAMQVIPKLIEGWDVKYVTGSGQTHFTANRVHIFEVEGNTKANHRSKGGSKRNRLDGRRAGQPSKKELAGMIPRRRRRAHKRKTAKEEDSVSDEELIYVYNDAGSTDGDEEDDASSLSEEVKEVNEDIKQVFKSFAEAGPYQRDETSEMELIRDISNMRFDENNNNTDQDLVPMQRDISWKEIPTYNSNNNMNYNNYGNPNFVNNSSNSSAAVFPSVYYDGGYTMYPSPMNSMEVANSSNTPSTTPNPLPPNALNDIFGGYYVHQK